MSPYRELKTALAILGLPQRATLAQIRDRHRALVRRHHPDAGGADDDQIRRINAAYRLLCDYCRSYAFDFGYEEYLEQCPEERLREQFATDPLWSTKEDPER